MNVADFFGNNKTQQVVNVDYDDKSENQQAYGGKVFALGKGYDSCGNKNKGRPKQWDERQNSANHAPKHGILKAEYPEPECQSTPLRDGDACLADDVGIRDVAHFDAKSRCVLLLKW